MSINCFEIDKIATDILIGQKGNYNKLPFCDDIKKRILDIQFDCTPNWGICGTTDNLSKENWYFLDQKLEKLFNKNINFLNVNNIYDVLSKALVDILSQKVKIEGFSIYGSFLYTSNNAPNDLDILVLISGVEGITYDALKYRVDNMEDLFINTERIPINNELGLTIISIDQLKPENKNYIIPDAAILDKGTSYTVGKSINAPQIPNFIINQNSQKLISWGLSSLYNNSETTIKRIKEALFMREYLYKREISSNILKNIPRQDLINNDIYSKSKGELQKISFQILDILKEDEQKIRNNLVNK